MNLDRDLPFQLARPCSWLHPIRLEVYCRGRASVKPPDSLLSALNKLDKSATPRAIVVRFQWALPTAQRILRW